jgi:hypothetical protein
MNFKSREDYDPYFYDPDAEREAAAIKADRMEAYWEMRYEMQREDEAYRELEKEQEDYL